MVRDFTFKFTSVWKLWGYYNGELKMLHTCCDSTPTKVIMYNILTLDIGGVNSNFKCSICLNFFVSINSNPLFAIATWFHLNGFSLIDLLLLCVEWTSPTTDRIAPHNGMHTANRTLAKTYIPQEWQVSFSRDLQCALSSLLRHRSFSVSISPGTWWQPVRGTTI